MKRLLPLFVIMVITALTSCQKRPDYVMSESKMADVLADLTIVDQLALREQTSTGVLPSDSSLKVMRQSILQKHDVSEAQFDSTLVWYGHHIDQFSDLYKTVEQRLAKRQKAINSSVGIEESNTNNLWPLQRMISIGRNDATNGVSFSLPGNKITVGNDVVWKFRTTNLSSNATVLLAAEYPDQEIVFSRMGISTEGSQQVILHTLQQRTPTRIFGYIHFTDLPQRRIYLDSISLTQRPSLQASPNTSVIPPLR